MHAFVHLRVLIYYAASDTSYDLGFFVGRIIIVVCVGFW